MARIEMDGMDLLDDLQSIMDLPEELLHDMLNAEANVVVDAQKEEIERLGIQDTGQLKESIARTAKMRTSTSDFAKYIDVYPQGTRSDGKRNAEIGFVHEFGAPHRGIPAKGWMSSANEKSADDAVSAAEEVFEKFLKEKNL